MSSALSCPDCAASCAVDQRYCTECGRRIRPLPHRVAATLTAMAAPGRIGPDRLSSTRSGAGGAATTTGGPRLTLFGTPLELPSPRALAVAVMAVLAFGVIVGSSNFSLASSPLEVTVNRPAGPAAVAPAAAPATTPQVTPTPSPTPPTASSGGSGSAAPNPSSASVPSSSSGSSGSSGSSNSSGSSSSSSASSQTSSSDDLPPIKHVWVIELGDQGYASTFANTSSDKYLNSTLAKQGEVVPNVYASATSDLANEVALVTGQGPTVQTEDNCPQYSAISPGTLTDGQVTGSGCVYPETTPSFESELTTAGDSWKAYVQGQGVASTDSCITPTLGDNDSHFTPSSVTGYVTWRNPMVYLDDVTSSGSCAYDDTGLTRLKTDLASAATTPNVSFIYPNSCDDGSATPCLPGAASGTKESDAFLKSVVPEIMASEAYKQAGMILITFAQAPQSGSGADQSSCCDQPVQYPNLPTADYEPGPSTGTTTTGTTASGTTTTGATTTGATTIATGATTTGTAPTTASATTTAVTPPSVAATVGTATTSPAGVGTGTGTARAITLPDLPGPRGTTTDPDGIITGTDTTVTAVSPSPSASACPVTTTTGTDTTGAATGTTTTGAGTTGTTGSTTTGATTTETTAATACCPTASPTGTTTTGATATNTTATGTTATGTTTDTTTTSVCCPAAAATTTGTTTTGTTATTTGTGTTSTGTTATGTTTTGAPTAGCASASPGPDSTSPTGGGGQTGMLVLSRYVSPNLQDGTDYFNTFSITASLEQLFGLKYTGYADISGLPLFSGFLYSNYSG